MLAEKATERVLAKDSSFGEKAVAFTIANIMKVKDDSDGENSTFIDDFVNKEEVEGAMAGKGYIGSIVEYDLSEDWELWQERLEQFFTANDVEEEKKVPLLITFLGNKGYALLRELCTPEGEDIKSFVANLKKLSMNCNFGMELKTHLRDQFVFGVSCKSTKKHLLKEKSLTFDSAVLFAQSTKTVTRDAEGMGESTEMAYSTAVNYVSDKKNKNLNQNDKTSDQQGNSNINCYCCGKPNHKKPNCRYRNYQCNVCHEVGHLTIVCKVAKSQSSSYSRDANNFKTNSQNNSNSERVNFQGYNFNNNNNRSGIRTTNFNRDNSKQNCIDEVDNFEQEFNNLYHLSEDENKTKIKPLKIKVTVENVKIMFEIDTGSPITAMSSTYFFGRQELKCLRMYESNRIFKSYSGDTIVPIGLVKVDVLFANLNCKLLLYVLLGNRKPILGRDWLDALGIIKNFECKLNEIKVTNECGSRYLAIVKEFKNVFTDKLGTYNRRTFKLELKPNVTPKFCKPRPVAYALREKVEAEIDRLIKLDVAEKVESSEWATPMVPIMKSNGQVRICGNYKITLNKHLIVNRHPIPRTQDLLAMLKGGEIEELLLKDIPGVLKFFDDILITGKDVHEHHTRLKEVLLHFNNVGYTIDAEGIHVSEKKIVAIKKVEIPKNVKELQVFLGYCDKIFVGNELRIVMKPLRKLRLPIKITVDAGPEGIEAEASYIFPDGNCRPFAFASRSHTPAEQTDYKPLIYIFGDKKGLPVMASNKVQRWSVILAAYDYELSKERELTLENGCVMWGYRVCVPLSIREEMLNELHSSHMGVVRMKMLARKYVWWPSMDRQIENKCKQYFCGPIDGKMHNVILHSHLKWFDIRELNNIIAETTIDVFRDYFVTWGIPKKLVTDHGPTFISKLFEDFMLANGVTHIKCVPYHPASNGAAENAVKTCKAKIKILNRQCSTRKEALAKYLFHYRSSPHCTTGVSPAELQMGRKFRTRWDLLKENVGNRVALKQADRQKFFRGNRKVSFDEGKVVMARDYANGNWRKAEVSKQISPITYNVTTNDQQEWKRHNDVIDKDKVNVFENDFKKYVQSNVIKNTDSPKVDSIVQNENVYDSKVEECNV
ncbi:uncharacterized protein K02A2.6-like [Phymastichus coffea]|uniref:uncharacterized protein K02A2.6-like n=1 Tax=Phymastichus coffea TaxID=108790 RepID=UPI00273C2CF9|nr:uncharacterized protein K02A2.6-like [Phymastichus coffea]